MKVLGLISSPADPASRARIIQYKDYFSASGHSLVSRFFTPTREADPAPWTYRLKKLTGISEWRTTDTFKTLARLPLLVQQYNYDIIWQNRLLLPHHSYFENKFRKPVVFDFDDAIWLNEGEKEVIKKIASAAMVFAGNEFLAGFAARYNKNIQVVPSCIDTGKLFPSEKKTAQFTIGWTGTKSNFQYLELIKTPVLDFISRHPDTSFTIVSSEKPSQFNFDDKRVIFKHWSPETEHEVISSFSVGLMPLQDTEWTRGKCGYKMLQYMACGIPVIVSPVGVNKQLLATGDIGFAATSGEDWTVALNDLKNNPADAREKGRNGRRIVELNYSCPVMTPVILEHFKKLVN
jgi:glycosyltransferase involved in cell wall biosynthesis